MYLSLQVLACLLAFFWGVALALFVQFTRVGQWLTIYLTWFVVSVGVGVDLLIAQSLMDKAGRVLWMDIVLVIAASSVPLAIQGLYDLYIYFQKWAEKQREISNVGSNTPG